MQCYISWFTDHTYILFIILIKHTILQPMDLVKYYRTNQRSNSTITNIRCLLEEHSITWILIFTWVMFIKRIIILNNWLKTNSRLDNQRPIPTVFKRQEKGPQIQYNEHRKNDSNIIHFNIRTKIILCMNNKDLRIVDNLNARQLWCRHILPCDSFCNFFNLHQCEVQIVKSCALDTTRLLLLQH